jgi:hypothetical protein
MTFTEKLHKYHDKYKHDEAKMNKIYSLFEELVLIDLKEENVELYEDFIDEFEDTVDFVEEEEITSAITFLRKKRLI